MTEQEIKRLVSEVVDSLSGEMTLNLALKLTDAVKQKADEMGVKAVVAVSNAAGNPVSVQCMNDAYIASYDIAVNKAYTVAALKMPTSALKSLAAPGGELYGIQFTNGGKIVIFGGGVPLYDKHGTLLGGLGVSGGTEGEDTDLAEYGGKVFSTLL
ncbi:MAG: heme-binding protein [Clostridia bacterium]|nr:heme-binding protein [Clostridia bacterium]